MFTSRAGTTSTEISSSPSDSVLNRDKVTAGEFGRFLFTSQRQQSSGTGTKEEIKQKGAFNSLISKHQQQKEEGETRWLAQDNNTWRSHLCRSWGTCGRGETSQSGSCWMKAADSQEGRLVRGSESAGQNPGGRRGRRRAPSCWGVTAPEASASCRTHRGCGSEAEVQRFNTWTRCSDNECTTCF